MSWAALAENASASLGLSVASALASSLRTFVRNASLTLARLAHGRRTVATTGR